MSLIQAMQNETRTTNGMVAFKSSLNPLVDFFSKVGDARGIDMTGYFDKALEQNPDVTLRTLLWARDIRGGAGERQTFRNLIIHAVESGIEIPEGFLHKVPEVGRWDDLLVLVDTKYEDLVFDMIGEALASQDGLCAKWMPRQGAIAQKIRTHLGMSPKQWRKTLVTLTSVVEQKMCANAWNKIEYKTVPSKAVGIYSKAFARHDGERFQDYKDAATKGEVKVNASAIFPCDIVHNSLYGDTQLAEAQWKNLPDYCEGSEERLLAVVDVSGSMGAPVDNKSSVTCMDVAISLGIYTAEKMQGEFHESFITFTDRPEVISFGKGSSLQHKIARTKRYVGYSTNIEGVFDAVLTSAVRNKIPEEQMPTTLVIMSDMQFNAQIGDFNTTSFEMAKKKYEKAGYNLPRIVYWNIGAGKYGNSPVTAHETGAVMVSGFSPAILKGILKGAMTPEQMLIDAVMIERYKFD